MALNCKIGLIVLLLRINDNSEIKCLGADTMKCSAICIIIGPLDWEQEVGPSPLLGLTASLVQ